MRAKPLHIERALERLTIGVHQDALRRGRMLADGHTGEVEQQLHVTLGGVAGNIWGFADIAFNFELPFLYAPIQRRSELTVPHFTSGVEFTTAAPTPIIVQPAIVGWQYSEENWIIGASVRFHVAGPEMAHGVAPFVAVVHLRFQGYTSYAESDDFSS